MWGRRCCSRSRRPSVYFASRPAGEALSIALALVGWTQLSQRAPTRVGLGAALTALACIARPNLLLLPAGWTLLALARRRYRSAGLIAVVTGIALLPTTLHNLRASGHVVPVSSNAGMTLYHGNGPGAGGAFTRPDGFSGNLDTQREEATTFARRRSGEDLDPVEADRWWGREAVRVRLADPAGTVRLVLRRTWWTLSTREFGLESHPELDRNPWRPTFRAAGGELAWIPWALVVAIAAFAWLRPPDPELLWAVLATLAMPIAFYVSSRYRLPAVAFACVVAAHGLGGVAALWRGERLGLRGWLAPIAGFVLLLLSASAPVAETSRQQQAASLGNLAVSLERKGRYDQALGYLERALAIDAENPVLLFNRGLVYERNRPDRGGRGGLPRRAGTGSDARRGGHRPGLVDVATRRDDGARAVAGTGDRRARGGQRRLDRPRAGARRRRPERPGEVDAGARAASRSDVRPGDGPDGGGTPMSRLASRARPIPVLAVLVLTLGLAGVVGCSEPASGVTTEPGPGAFEGRWRRAGSEFDISIRHDGPQDGARDDSGWAFCQSGGTIGVRETIECVDGERSLVRSGTDFSYEIDFEPTYDERRGVLRIAVRGVPRSSTNTEYRSVEDFRLSADGRRLWRYTVSVNGERRFPPLGPIRYDKISDRPL